MRPTRISSDLFDRALILLVETSSGDALAPSPTRSSTRWSKVPTAASGPDASRSLHSEWRSDETISLRRHSPDDQRADGEKQSGTVTCIMSGGNGTKNQAPSRMARRIVTGRRARLNESTITNGSPPSELMASSSTPDGFVGSHRG